MWVSGVTVYSGVFVVVACMIILQMNEWRWLSASITVVNAGMYVSFVAVWSTFESTKVYGILHATLGSGNFWLTVLLLASICLLPVATVRKFRALLNPSVVASARLAAADVPQSPSFAEVHI